MAHLRRSSIWGIRKMACSLSGLLWYQLTLSYWVSVSSSNISRCFLGTAVTPVCAVRSRKGWLFATSTEALVDGHSCKGVYVCLLCCVQDMCAAEATASLLQVEETFSACLARIDALILKPLLQAGRSDYFFVCSSSFESLARLWRDL